jgi:1,4-dihydroxy-2-naphthoate octaprenyltransferase
MMSLRQWLLLLLTCLVGVDALFVAAEVGSAAVYGIGLLVFAAAVVYAFVQVKWRFDRLDAERH